MTMFCPMWTKNFVFTVFLISTLLALVDALPPEAFDMPHSADQGPQNSTTFPVSQDNITAHYVRPLELVRVSFCSNAAVKSMQCGAPCDALGGQVEVFVAGGNNAAIPNFYIAYDNSSQSIVVAHQGTNTSNLVSLLNDVQLELVDLNTTRFNNTNGTRIQVHKGFQKTFEQTADIVLSTVHSGLQSKNASKVLVVGHSLGAAVATLDTMYLRAALNRSIAITATVFGLPRVGDQAWANYVEKLMGQNFTYITNQHDPVPNVPPRRLGYKHPAREVHINAVDSNGNATDVVACQGEENTKCSDANTIDDLNVNNHAGPYFQNITIGALSCTV